MSHEQKLPSYTTRRRWSLILLLIWMPLYVILAIPFLAAINEWNIWLRVIIYIFAAFLWVLPFRFAFLGVGRADESESEGASPPKSK